MNLNDSTVAIEVRVQQAKALATDKTPGVKVTNVERGSPAAQSRLQPGDIIVSVNRKAITNVDEFTEAMKDTERQTALFIKRGGEDVLLIVQ